ncbi:uncharacterized protein LOC131217435 [Magnolia sinica]|uniref:uncharacterized protein LOC131217435 n=1 Tax=Magnolia sinica TaxID=86752 RepID=UPI00265A92F5|nr:uncharacterized protein LOC131217435 [Magnolia sinica]
MNKVPDSYKELHEADIDIYDFNIELDFKLMHLEEVQDEGNDDPTPELEDLLNKFDSKVNVALDDFEVGNLRTTKNPREVRIGKYLSPSDRKRIIECSLMSPSSCNSSRPKPFVFFFKHQKMSSKPPDITADVPPSVLDFREYDNDAWYGVRLVLEGETLTVKFLDFGDESDKRLGPSDFEDQKALDDFAERFRPTSVQLQDGECRRVIEGKTVCASHTFGDDDVRFYDAVVETVYSSEHTFDKGEEQCLCEFVLFWQHGPIAGTKTLTSIEHICLIQPGSAQNDPNLDFFFEISRKKLELGSHRPSFVTEHEISANACAACFNETCGSAVKCEPNMRYKPQTFNSKNNVDISGNKMGILGFAPFQNWG